MQNILGSRNNSQLIHSHLLEKNYLALDLKSAGLAYKEDKNTPPCGQTLTKPRALQKRKKTKPNIYAKLMN
jgi:hypothetical protein